MPYAAVTFDTVHAGEHVRLEAGKDWVREGHSLHRRFPDKFRAGPKPPMGRRTGRRGGRRGLSAPLPAGPARVVVTPSAWQELREIIYEYDGDESGAGLFGEIRGDRVIVERVLAASAWAERSENEFRIEPDLYRRFEAARGVTWLGDFHLHREAGPPKPSQPDFDGWRAMVRARVGAYVGMVATVWMPGEDWLRFEPRFVAWVATRNGGLRPATIIRGG
jgi:hypothetical protein